MTSSWSLVLDCFVSGFCPWTSHCLTHTGACPVSTEGVAYNAVGVVYNTVGVAFSVSLKGFICTFRGLLSQREKLFIKKSDQCDRPVMTDALWEIGPEGDRAEVHSGRRRRPVALAITDGRLQDRIQSKRPTHGLSPLHWTSLSLCALYTLLSLYSLLCPQSILFTLSPLFSLSLSLSRSSLSPLSRPVLVRHCFYCISLMWTRVTADRVCRVWAPPPHVPKWRALQLRRSLFLLLFMVFIW